MNRDVVIYNSNEKARDIVWRLCLRTLCEVAKLEPCNQGGQGGFLPAGLSGGIVQP